MRAATRARSCSRRRQRSSIGSGSPTLPANPRSLVDAIRRGDTTFARSRWDRGVFRMAGRGDGDRGAGDHRPARGSVARRRGPGSARPDRSTEELIHEDTEDTERRTENDERHRGTGTRDRPAQGTGTSRSLPGERQGRAGQGVGDAGGRRLRVINPAALGVPLGFRMGCSRRPASPVVCGRADGTSIAIGVSDGAEASPAMFDARPRARCWRSRTAGRGERPSIARHDDLRDRPRRVSEPGRSLAMVLGGAHGTALPGDGAGRRSRARRS